MKLVTFSDAAGTRVGVLDAGWKWVTDLSVAAPSLPREMGAFIAAGEPAVEAARKASSSDRGQIALDRVRLLAPIPRPSKNILCVGKNYHEHAKEFHQSGFDASAGKDAIPSANDPTNSVDYEGELTVVIGAVARNVKKADAFRHVYGYTIINDATARTLQHRHKQWFLGKSLDGFCPMGPCIVTADEVPDVTKLQLQTRVNGELRQNAPVSDLIFDIPTLIEEISGLMTLEPGDLIATGTCAGVGIGFNPPKYLKRGDIVAVTIEPIGTLSNPVS